MSNLTHDLIKQRVSTSFYDRDRALDPSAITALIDLATRAPSAYNMQNWSFVVVQSEQAKQRLLPITYGQQKVVDAAATIIVCGRLDGHTRLLDKLQPALDQGVVQEEVARKWANVAHHNYHDRAQRQRDEAIRSASLAGMTLMLAAQAQGLATGPMIGFDADALAREFGLDEQEVPAMLITVGYASEGNWSQKPRVDVQSVLRFV